MNDRQFEVGMVVTTPIRWVVGPVVEGLAGLVELSWWAWDRSRDAVLDAGAYLILRAACRARRHNETCPAWHRPHPSTHR